MDKIILASGQSVDTDFCFATSQRLIITVYGMTLPEAVSLLSDPDETRILTNRHANGREVTHEGYTKITAVTVENDHLRLILEA